MMVKVILGSAAGGFVAAGLALGAWTIVQVRSSPAPNLPAAAVAPVLGAPTATTVACGPLQEPTVARVLVNGQEMATLACVDRAPQGYVSYAPAGYAAVQPQVVTVAAPAPVRVVQPAVRSVPAQARPARQVVYRDAEDEVVRYEPDARQGRSVAKTAMIIGGSAGTGAGVGAIFGGKKGALIGAAIGGGAASIYEASKR